MPPPPELCDDEVAVVDAVEVDEDVTDVVVELEVDDTEVVVVASPPAPPLPESSPQATRAIGADTRSQPAVRRARFNEGNEGEDMRSFSSFGAPKKPAS